MKKKLSILIAALLLTFSISFANNSIDPTPTRIVQQFNSDFAKATGTKWQTRATYYKASFIVDGQNLEAFYSLTGESIAVSRSIVFNQIPFVLQRALKPEYKNYKTTELYELVTENGTEYFMSLENGTRQLTLKGSGSSWSLYKI